MPVQDDVRERQLLQLFNLHVPVDRKRAETDAFLRFDGLTIPFELKSSTGTSVSTVRDFGPDHITKWKDKHWIFGFYDRTGERLQYCHYASPAGMAAWIKEKEEYIGPDLVLAHSLPKHITAEFVVAVLGASECYSKDDARLIMKNQWNAEQYRQARDLPDGYSLDRMVEVLRERCAYVIRRGSTLNNPHIPKKYFAGWEQIVEDHAATLRTMVRDYLAPSADATATATE